MAWFGWKTIGEAQRYTEEANRIRLAESVPRSKCEQAMAHLANPVSQNEAQAVENIGAGK
jgi:hypothetical protein